jgi:hypothetical protein
MIVHEEIAAWRKKESPVPKQLPGGEYFGESQLPKW